MLQQLVLSGGLSSELEWKPGAEWMFVQHWLFRVSVCIHDQPLLHKLMLGSDLSSNF